MSDLPDSPVVPDVVPDVADPAPVAVPAGASSWQDQDPILRDLWMKNQTPQQIADILARSVPAIMTRAARLGLPRRSAPGRKPGVRRHDRVVGGAAMPSASVPRASRGVYGQEPAPVVQTTLRVCLMCLTKFESAGRHNRICSSCKGSSEYESASSLPELHIPVS